MTYNVRHGTHISNINIDPRLRIRVPSGVDFMDQALGHGGFVPSNVMMLTGDPGVGKSTLVLQVANSLHAAGHVCLLNSTEQAPENIKLMAERMELKHGFYVGDDTNLSKILVNANAIHKMASGIDKHMFLIIDSLPEVKITENAEPTPKAVCEVAKQLRDWAKKTYAIVIFINHVTKSGEFAGKNTILHEIDQHAQIRFDKMKTSPTFGERLFSIGKNRWGVSGVTSILQMTETGLQQSGQLVTTVV